MLCSVDSWRALVLTASPWSADHCQGLSVEVSPNTTQNEMWLAELELIIRVPYAGRLQARCSNDGCEAHARPVLCNLGFRTFDMGFDFADDVLCPICNSPCSEEAASLWFANCHWEMDGREAGGARQVQAGVADAVPHTVTDAKQRWRALRVTAAEAV